MASLELMISACRASQAIGAGQTLADTAAVGPVHDGMHNHDELSCRLRPSHLARVH